MAQRGVLPASAVAGLGCPCKPCRSEPCCNSRLDSRGVACCCAYRQTNSAVERRPRGDGKVERSGVGRAAKRTGSRRWSIIEGLRSYVGGIETHTLRQVCWVRFGWSRRLHCCAMPWVLCLCLQASLGQAADHWCRPIPVVGSASNQAEPRGMAGAHRDASPPELSRPSRPLHDGVNGIKARQGGPAVSGILSCQSSRHTCASNHAAPSAQLICQADAWRRGTPDALQAAQTVENQHARIHQ